MGNSANSSPPATGSQEKGLGIGEIAFRRAFSGDKCMLSLAGELRHGNSEELFSETVRLYESGVTDLILDFRTLDFCDTAGLQSLVRIYKYVQDNSKLSFVILVHEGELDTILRTCRFDKFMHITHDDSIAAGDWQQR